MNETQEMPAKLAAFVDFKSGNWRRVAVGFTEDHDKTLETALVALELMKKAHYAPHQLTDEEIAELEKLYVRVKKAHPELGLA